MVVSDRILMGPGPCNPYPEATAGLARPLLGHLDPEFLAILDETCDRLRTVWRTANPLTLPVSGTGSAGMEAAFVNTVLPGDVVVIGSTACSASACAMSPTAAAPRSSGWTRRGGNRWIPPGS
jgi:alanine-glyoxylate transaminase/serine-glyoxylate transaminase/serine-pyruvate transaminase